MLERMTFVLVEVLAPVLAIVGLGALVQRYRHLHVDTMVRLNLYFFVPVFLFVRIVDSRLSWTEIGGIGAAVILPMLLLGGLIYQAMRWGGANRSKIAAIAVGGLFFNAGFFGIPVAELAFGAAGGQVQALVVMFMNTMIFFAGYGIVAMGQGYGLRAAVVGYFRLPMIYAIAAALAIRETGAPLPSWVDSSLGMIAGGMVPVALATLGAQLATRARWPQWWLILPVVSLKLLVLPALTALISWLLGLWPWPAAALILASAAPTAINTLLLTIEVGGDADTAAECVFWTTLGSVVTITIILAGLQAAGAGPPA